MAHGSCLKARGSRLMAKKSLARVPSTRSRFFLAMSLESWATSVEAWAKSLEPWTIHNLLIHELFDYLLQELAMNLYENLNLWLVQRKFASHKIERAKKVPPEPIVFKKWNFIWINLCGKDFKKSLLINKNKSFWIIIIKV